MCPVKKAEVPLVSLGTPDEYHQYGNSFDCTWPEQGIRMDLTRLAEDHGDVTGYVEVLKLKDGKPTGRIGWEKLNLTSSNRRHNFALSLARVHNTYDWDKAIDWVAYHTVTDFRKGEPMRDLSQGVPNRVVLYLVRHFIPLNDTAILYGDPESGKSLICMLIATLVASSSQIPLPGNLEVLGHGKVLYLDWETGFDDQHTRLALVAEGLGIARPAIIHKKMERPLCDSYEEIKSYIAKENIKLVVIDSMLPATGGNPNQPEPAQNFCNAVRALGDKTTKIVIGQVKKGEKNTQEEQDIMASVIFKYLGRANWEVRRLEIAGSQDFKINCFLRKKNNIPKLPPIGFNVKFIPDLEKSQELNEDVMKAVDFTYLDVSNDREGRAYLPHKVQIFNLLRHYPVEGLTYQEMSDELNLPLDTLRSRIHEMDNVEVYTDMNKVKRAKLK